jgi:hypothetical protein
VTSRCFRFLFFAMGIQGKKIEAGLTTEAVPSMDLVLGPDSSAHTERQQIACILLAQGRKCQRLPPRRGNRLAGFHGEYKIRDPYFIPSGFTDFSR